MTCVCVSLSAYISFKNIHTCFVFRLRVFLLLFFAGAAGLVLLSFPLFFIHLLPLQSLDAWGSFLWLQKHFFTEAKRHTTVRHRLPLICDFGIKTQTQQIQNNVQNTHFSDTTLYTRSYRPTLLYYMYSCHLLESHWYVRGLFIGSSKTST